MAKKKQIKKDKPNRGVTFRGGRKAESLGRQIERLKEKFPLNKQSAGEWLHYARVMKTTAEVLEVQAANELDPARLKVLKDVLQARGKAKADARGKDTEEEENKDEDG